MDIFTRKFIMKFNQVPLAPILSLAVATGIAPCLQAQNPGQNATPAQLVDALHTTFGDHHSRAVHAKGIILEGEFTPDAQAAKWTKATHLQKTKSTVIVRFSDFT